MFNFDGAIVAGVISDQLAAKTFIDILESRRDAKRAGGPTEQDYVDLLNAYNQLVVRFNRVIENDKIENEKNRQIDLGHAEAIAARNRQITALNNENANLRHSLALEKRFGDAARAELYKALDKVKSAGLPE